MVYGQETTCYLKQRPQLEGQKVKRLRWYRTKVAKEEN